MICPECNASLVVQPAHWSWCSRHDAELLARQQADAGGPLTRFLDALAGAGRDRARATVFSAGPGGEDDLSELELSLLDCGIAAGFNMAMTMLIEQGLLNTAELEKIMRGEAAGG